MYKKIDLIFAFIFYSKQDWIGMSGQPKNNSDTVNDDIYDSVSNQTCGYCGEKGEYNGWENLCDRSCYYGLSNLLYKYESFTDPSVIPDPRLVDYFTKYVEVEPQHSFIFNKLKKYLYLLDLKKS